MNELTAEQESKLRFEVQQTFKEIISHYEEAGIPHVDVLSNEIRNTLVGVWCRFEIAADEPEISVQISSGRILIHAANETAALMLYGRKSLREGAILSEMAQD